MENNSGAVSGTIVALDAITPEANSSSIEVTLSQGDTHELYIKWNDRQLKMAEPWEDWNFWNSFIMTWDYQDYYQSITVGLHISDDHLWTGSFLHPTVPYHDKSDSVHYFGRPRNDDQYLKGYIYQIGVYNAVLSLVEQEILNDPFFYTQLWGCDINEYLEEDVGCRTCPVGCTKGCIRNDEDNCRCKDIECADCVSFFFYSMCQDCTATGNASGVGNPCECNFGYSRDMISQDCQVVENCAADECKYCANGTTTFYGGCDICSEGYYLWPDTAACLAYCPSGSAMEKDSSACGELDSQVVSSVDFGSGVECGPEVTGFGTFNCLGEPWSPAPMMHRGHYFDGINDFIITDQLTLNSQFTISIWLEYESDGAILNLSSYWNTQPERYIYLLFVDDSGNKNVKLQFFGYEKEWTNEFNDSNWNMLTLTWTSQNDPNDIPNDIHDWVVYKNGVSVQTDTITGKPAFLDGQVGHFIGATADFSNNLAGYLYHINIYNQALSSIAVANLHSTGIQEFEFSPCMLDSYWNGNSCISCHDDCSESGCYFGGDQGCIVTKPIITYAQLTDPKIAIHWAVESTDFQIIIDDRSLNSSMLSNIFPSQDYAFMSWVQIQEYPNSPDGSEYELWSMIYNSDNYFIPRLTIRDDKTLVASIGQWGGTTITAERTMPDAEPSWTYATVIVCGSELTMKLCIHNWEGSLDCSDPVDFVDGIDADKYFDPANSSPQIIIG